tara:strand:- start:5622 stop:5852 length:231 start_codon:yes stop_codon:yes gene_type:complete
LISKNNVRAPPGFAFAGMPQVEIFAEPEKWCATQSEANGSLAPFPCVQGNLQGIFIYCVRPRAERTHKMLDFLVFR